MFMYQFFIITFVASDILMDVISSYMDVVPYALYYMIIPTYLVIGLVADICVGRYKIIVASIYCAFIGWITLCVSFYVTHKYFHFALVLVGYFFGTIGAAGVQSIAIPFIIDQMIGATADELSTIIYWQGFGYPFGLSLARTSTCFINVAHHQSTGICVSGVAITRHCTCIHDTRVFTRNLVAKVNTSRYKPTHVPPANKRYEIVYFTGRPRPTNHTCTRDYCIEAKWQRTVSL